MMEDLIVEEVTAQQVFLSEAYIQVYRRRGVIEAV